MWESLRIQRYNNYRRPYSNNFSLLHELKKMANRIKSDIIYFCIIFPKKLKLATKKRLIQQAIQTIWWYLSGYWVKEWMIGWLLAATIIPVHLCRRICVISLWCTGKGRCPEFIHSIIISSLPWMPPYRGATLSS